MLRVIVNQEPYDCQDGVTVLQALSQIGIDIPRLCHDDRLTPYGACRLCVVKVRGSAKPVPACTTPVIDGMEIETHPPEIEELRRSLLQLLAREQPPVEAAHLPHKEFFRYLRGYELDHECRAAGDPALVDESHPLIRVDMSRCVYCYRCVRICDEVQGQSVWRVWSRGAETRIRSDGPTFAESSCVSCGACVDTCPSGALEDKSVISLGIPTDWTRTTCPYCGTGCELKVGTRDGRLTQVLPVNGAPVSRGHLCVKGRYAFDFASSPDRVTDPLVRTGSGWQVVSWEDAINLVAAHLREVIDRHGPDSLGVLGSARATNEDNYLAQKFARIVAGTNNVDCCARVCHTPSAAALKAMLGTGASTNAFEDIEIARTILVCGANPTENHPIVGARIKQAARRGARLIVIDPRAIELAGDADVHLAPRPGTNVPLLNALAHTIVTEGLYDDAFVRDRVSDWDHFVDFVRDWTPERAATLCGVDAASIREAAWMYATERPSMTVHGLGLTEHVQGTESVMCLINLALITGNVGRPGTGVNPLRGQNNVQGAALMGCDPSILTGGASIAAGRSPFETIWGSGIPTTHGLHLMQMMDAAAAGRLKALWAIGYDVLLTNPNTSLTRKSFEAMEFVIVQDLFLTETARTFGSVFLPAAASFEKDGTFMNAERRIQRVRRAYPPPGQARPDWEIISAVARRMNHGAGFDFANVEAIWNEIRRVWSDVSGITYKRLDDEGGLCWPCPSEQHPGTQVLYEAGFPLGRAALRTIDFRPTPEVPTADFPFLLTTGRTLYQFNAGTMTGRSQTNQLRPTDVLEMSPFDATRLGVGEGERVTLTSRYGKTVVPATRSPWMKSGELFVTFHDPTIFLNEITGAERDAVVGAPEYKVTAVRIEKGRE